MSADRIWLTEKGSTIQTPTNNFGAVEISNEVENR